MPQSGRGVTRRDFLVAGGLVASGAAFVGVRQVLAGDSATGTAGTLATPIAQGGSSTPPKSAEAPPSATATVTTKPAQWSDPAAWPDGEGVPATGSVVTLDRPIMLDVDVELAGLMVGPSGSLVFDPEASRTLTSTGSVVVHGQLVMHPVDDSVTHTIKFMDVDERAFVGDGIEPVDTDIGLWIIHDGEIDVAGTQRLGWARAAGELRKGATSIALEANPIGWRAGDEIVVTPTAPPNGENSEEDFEIVTIEGISGREVRLNEKLRHNHPAVKLGDRRVMTAEILNLTRNVRIEGTPDGRAHVMVHSSRPQSIRFATFRYLGPRQLAKEFTEGVVGRYPLHFHICEDGSRGTIVEGTVVRDAGHHAFVAHTSHGITFRDCVSFDVFDDAYWWDQAPDNRIPGPPTHDLLYDRCLAALVRFDPPFRGYRLNGFRLSRGRGNVAQQCVAVGVLGSGNASGFHWPEGSAGVWLFEDCIAHNCLNGIFTWQNTDKEHVISKFVAYHNQGFGIEHGAYSNPYHYRDSVLHGNAGGAILIHATSRDAGLRFTNILCDGTDRSEYLVKTAEHTFDTDQPTRFTGCTFRGAQAAAFGLTTVSGERDVINVADCTFDGNEFWIGNGIHPRSELHVRDSIHGSIVLRRNDQDGELHLDWNARVAPV